MKCCVIDVPENTPEPLLIALGITSALTVCFMVLSFMLTTLVLVGILKAFDLKNTLATLTPEANVNELVAILHPSGKPVSSRNNSSLQYESFREFWNLRCAEDFKKAFRYFTFGVPMFMINLGIASWVKFLRYKVTCSFISVIILVSLVMWYRMHRKWGEFLVQKVHGPQHHPRFFNQQVRRQEESNRDGKRQSADEIDLTTGNGQGELLLVLEKGS